MRDARRDQEPGSADQSRRRTEPDAARRPHDGLRRHAPTSASTWLQEPSHATSSEPWLGLEFRHLAALQAVADEGSFNGDRRAQS